MNSLISLLYYTSMITIYSAFYYIKCPTCKTEISCNQIFSPRENFTTCSLKLFYDLQIHSFVLIKVKESVAFIIISNSMKCFYNIIGCQGLVKNSPTKFFQLCSIIPMLFSTQTETYLTAPPEVTVLETGREASCTCC